MLLQEFLVLALQVLFERDVSNLEDVVLVSETGVLLSERPYRCEAWSIPRARLTPAWNSREGSPSRSRACESISLVCRLVATMDSKGHTARRGGYKTGDVRRGLSHAF